MGLIIDGIDYSDLTSKTAMTVRFICCAKWKCPLCGEMTKISLVRCEVCRRDMGINKYRFEFRLKRICPAEIFDYHKISSTQYDDDGIAPVELKGGEQGETLFD